LMARRTNCLVLDEPTNHLDLASVEQLEAALIDYSGTILLVSHDRRLLDKVPATRTIRVDAGQVIEI
jgi:ATPase subunit of ABC transporter with duplicated ATPase domains